MAAVSESMWSALESGVDLHKRLASALGDAQYFDESIAPSEIRRELQKAGTSDFPILIKAMKWLLASISKGRDVTEFYPDVIKLVACPNLEVRKMVYTYMLHNQHSDSKLSLLSINSFQRGLSDAEPLIRAMALRALTSVQLQDILQIQILAISKHARNDASPYVRKYAAMAIAKVANRCQTGEQRELLLELVQQMLDHDPATMVLSSAMVAFHEITKDGETKHLGLLHGSFRKICTLLTDMDEWGQVVCIEVLMRYCRHFFREPNPSGSAEQIDASRRVVRDKDGNLVDTPALEIREPTREFVDSAPSEQRQALPKQTRRRIIRRRVIKKGFYSDEEDESTEEEIFADMLESTSKPFPAAQREPEIASGEPTTNGEDGTDDEENALDDDHRRLLHAAMPLLKSRNAGVVLAVCSLQYYCGVSSVRIRKALGKALVRIHRHSETQYVVLSSIRRLVRQCPSAFSPFLHDFFVLQMDAPQTKLVKLDILTSLALDPPSINTVLCELRAYVQIHPQDADDTEFVCAAIQAVGRVAELTKICYRRQDREAEAITIMLNCLYGVVTLSQASKDYMVVGEAVIAMRRILQILDSEVVSDPNNVRQKAADRLIALLLYTLSKVASATEDSESSDPEDDSNEDISGARSMERQVLVLPPEATAAALGFLSQTLASNPFKRISPVRAAVANLLLHGFVQLEEVEKEQALVFACKLLVSEEHSQEAQLCERLLALGRIDSNNVVRDRARYASNLINATVDMTFETESLDPVTSSSRLGRDVARKVLLTPTPAPSYLPIEKEDEFRFGSLSSMLGHRVRSSYLPLPPWAEEDSPSEVRDAAEPKQNGAPNKFYEQSDEESSSSSSASSADDEGSSSDSSSDSSSETDSSEQEETRNDRRLMPRTLQSPVNLLMNQPPPHGHKVASIRTSESSGSSSDSFSDSSSDGPLNTPTGKLIQLDQHYPNGTSSIGDDLKGLVIDSPTARSSSPPEGSEFSSWFQVLRPEHANGLSVQARFLRGKSRHDQLLSFGWASKPSVVCLQFRFENSPEKPPQRRIRIVQRVSGSSGSSIGPARIISPNTIDILSAGATIDSMLAIEFQSLSDRDGILVAKLEIKAGSGGRPIEIKPSIGEMLQPTQRTIEEFDKEMGRMHGFNRVQSTCALSDKSDMRRQVATLVSLSPIGHDECKEGWWRFVGALPSSGDLVFVLVQCANGSQAKITVCCDHALVINAIMKLIKSALANQDIIK